MPKDKTTKDDIADFCRVMIRLNKKYEGKLRVCQILAKAIKARGIVANTIFNIPNDEILKGLDILLNGKEVNRL